jgi:uncharacterized membrane protein
MLDDIRQWFGIAGYVLEGVGVFTIVIGCIVATAWFAKNLRGLDRLAAYESLRRDLGRSIVLGLEFLIAGDIIRTVTVSPTFESVAILASIVLIRTFLTMMLTLEIEGRWPWQRARGGRTGAR